MKREAISAFDLALTPFGMWEKSWALLASGDLAAKRFNCMTVSWGSLGVIWGKPFAMVVVRPQRYTYEFIEKADNFTLSVFPAQYRSVLEVLGTKSGRQIDKIHKSGLTPIASTQVTSPSFDEAELILECRKMYFQDLDPQHFLADFIPGMYNNDYHRMYFGEVAAVWGTENYRMPRA